MKIYKYGEFNEFEPVNEELLGGLVNFFKTLFKKMNDEITRLENDPNKIRDYVVNTMLNYKSPNSLFKTEYDNFVKNTKNIKDQAGQIDAVKNFINEILGPKNGVLGEAGINKLFADKSMQGEKIKPKRIAIQFILNTAKAAVTKAIVYNPKDQKFGRNEAGQFIDKTILKGIKDVLPKDTKTPVNLPNVQKWIETNIFIAMQNAAKAVTEDQIREAQQKGGVKVEEGDTAMTYDRLKEFFDDKKEVIYLLKDKTKEQYDKTKAPEDQPDVVGVKPIAELKPEDGEDAVVFLNKDGQPVIKKSYEDIIGPAKEKTGTDVEQKLKDSLGKLKANPEAIGNILKISDILNDPNKKADADKILAAIPK
jgi:hypothetical protein